MFTDLCWLHPSITQCAGSYPTKADTSPPYPPIRIDYILANDKFLKLYTGSAAATVVIGPSTSNTSDPYPIQIGPALQPLMLSAPVPIPTPSQKGTVSGVPGAPRPMLPAWTPILPDAVKEVAWMDQHAQKHPFG